jgi:sugar phosphate isomerase/epimerase
MRELFNLSIYSLNWFNDNWDEVLEFCDKNGFAGVELLAKGLKDYELIEEIPERLVKGLHLSYYLNWLPLGEESQISVEELVNNYKWELKLAKKLNVDYVVFHASNIEMEEIFIEEFKYEKVTILSEVAKVINEALVDLDINFKLLFENLWWSGLTFLDRNEAVKFLKKINYQNTGFLLDTGHLMNTNLELDSESEGIEYIKEVMSAFDDSLDLFQGVHLHKSLSGTYRQQNRDKVYHEFKDNVDQEIKYKLVGGFISNSDQHLPFSEVSPLEMLELINPDYLTHEFTCATKDEFIDQFENTNFEIETEVQ